MKKENQQKKSKKQTKNKEFAVIAYLFLGMFLCLMLYMVYFQVFKSEDFINSPYNTRQDTFSSYVVRGEIQSADGKVLAETITDDSGNETRNYPYGDMYAHVVGFSTNGKSGIESTMNFNLLRSHSFIVERVINELKGEKNTGDNVVTTLESKLQETAYYALGNYNGAVIVMEPSTGKILAMVSKPDFNPNTIEEDWAAITAEDSEESVLLNRATQGLYPPGSTFKMITTLEYIRENPDYADYSFDCGSEYTEEGTTIHCYKNLVHGTEDLMDSFANSCNTSYASLGLSLNRTSFRQLCSDLLFDKKLPGNFETSKSRFSMDENTPDGIVMQTVIGQGETLMTPLHMLLITSAIANDGVLMKPYVVDHTENSEGIEVKDYKPAVSSELLSEKEAVLMQEFMARVVEDGTASALNGYSYTAYGKTGSAEFSSNKNESHSWFTGYAHRDDKEDIAVVVIAEGAGSGSAVAVPIAKQIFSAYYGE